MVQKNVHFFFNEDVYKQTDNIVMGSPLGSFLAGIFMVEFEGIIVPVLQKYLSFWKQYADDIMCFVKIGIINCVITILNNFDQCLTILNISFTYKVEKDCKLPFLDVLLIKEGNNIITVFFCFF